jgi:hypothetical protein
VISCSDESLEMCRDIAKELSANDEDLLYFFNKAFPPKIP